MNRLSVAIAKGRSTVVEDHFLDCGAFSARVQIDEAAVRWTLIGYQNDYEPFALEDATTLVFEFDRQAHDETLDRLLKVLAARVAADSDGRPAQSECRVRDA